jgi:flagella basal body P-ring formation protein FlgA
MTIQPYLSNLTVRRLAVVGLAALVALPFTFGPAPAAGLMLKGDVLVDRDSLTLGDLVENAPETAAATALFRAPALGQTGTIQTRRIIEAATAAGLGQVETGGRLQIIVRRAAREVGASEIEAALRASLETSVGLDARTAGIVFEGTPPSLTLSSDVTGPVVASDIVYDRRSRRVSATIWIGPSANDRKASTRISGSVVELVDVAVVNRALARGDTVKDADISIERRPRDVVPPDALFDGGALAGRVARRAFAAGSLVRNGDLTRPELVTRGDVVTVVYEAPGMMLTMRAKASDGGALGDTVSITNPQSKKALQAVVTGPGKVSVNTAPTGRLAAAQP